MVLFDRNRLQKVNIWWFGGRTRKDPPVVILYDAQAGPIPAELWATDRRRHYLVLAASAPISVFKKWMKTCRIDFMTMDFFSRDELAWLQYVQGFCHYELD
jgi:hypothetical protein